MELHIKHNYCLYWVYMSVKRFMGNESGLNQTAKKKPSKKTLFCSVSNNHTVNNGTITITRFPFSSCLHII